MSKLEINLSSTAFGWSACVKHLHNRVVVGYKEIAAEARLVYGIAVHKYIDTMYKTKCDVGAATKAAKKAFSMAKVDDRKAMHLSDERHLLSTCMWIWSHWIENDSTFEVLMLNNEPASEITFSIKIYEDEFIIVYLKGTLDILGQFKGGCFAVKDWKTTSNWDTKNYFTQYEMSKQLRVYTLACKTMAELEPDSVLGKIGATKMGAVIDAIFLKPNSNENVIERSTVYQFPNEDIAAFKQTIIDYCVRLSGYIQRNEFPKEGILNGACDGKWGKCAFWNVCKNNDMIGGLILKRDFRIAPFDPANYNDFQ